MSLPLDRENFNATGRIIGCNEKFFKVRLGVVRGTNERQVCVARLIGPDRREHDIPLDLRSVSSVLMPPNWIYVPRICTVVKLAAPDSDRRTSGITLFYMALGLISSYLGRQILTVWFYEIRAIHTIVKLLQNRDCKRIMKVIRDFVGSFVKCYNNW